LLGDPTGTVLKVSSRHFPSLACMARWRRACGFRKRRHAADLGFRCPCRALSAGAAVGGWPVAASVASFVSAEYKLAIVAEYENAPNGGKGVILRRWKG
jgi:hypothetical protein